MLCAGTNCVSNKSFALKEAIEKELLKHNLQDEVLVVMTGCNGFCPLGPVMVVEPDDIFYHSLRVEIVPRLVEEHFLKGRPVKELMFTPPKDKKPLPTMPEIPFFNRQRLIAMKNRGLIDPESIEEYIARDGYRAIAKVLGTMTPGHVVEEMKASGLRGRGGAGFPTGLKWEAGAKSEGTQKYIICNADEGDPGAFMDRSIIEADPHSIIEGMMIGAYAIGASSGHIYIRMEYPLAVKRLSKAIEQAREYGLLGEKILGSDFYFDLEIFRGAGAFVCGEETSLIASLEGRPAEPRQRPPLPVQSGLWGKPTVINNVETFANVPRIILNGAAWFSAIGTEESKGTKVFSLAGKVHNAGLVEVPMGITLREIIFEIGGGIQEGRAFKAVQIGGPAGGFVPESMLDLPVDFESIQDSGAIMGSGGMVVIDEANCIVDMAKYFADFLRDESCGKCTSCREGCHAMHDVLSEICSGRGKESDIDLIEELGETIVNASQCGLGKNAPKPALTSIKHFRDEYLAHVRDRRCPAGVCKSLITFSINDQSCTGCAACAKSCPSDAIAGETKKAHSIDVVKCIKCGACKEICRFNAVVVQ
jgi:NADH:ubiquinone oxidoreductase subunit F (NADH-binding)/(2Fe-2S) ferredoxin/Pyruvate/2-oxoacid:ferredoxin oxidoreductase delta subunit